MYRQGWERQRVLELFAVLDWMMHLPDTLSQRLWQDIESIEGETRMRYVTSIERLAIARGMQKGMEQGLEQGLEQGIEQGMQHGKREEAAAIVAKLLTKRFGPLPESVRARMAQATLEQLDEWAERLLDAPSLDAVLGGH
jgi:flagellar biosynthesis/type III secretory pathway protein FliH